MRILFVRHGHPDYAHDCLTPLGHRHAEAAARRLKDEGIERIYSSTNGRALETAAHAALLLNLPVIRCDFMREISWGAADDQPLYENGHPWSTADAMVARGESLLDPDWAAKEPFRRNIAVEYARRVAAGLDAWLAEMGYTREGLYYRVTGTPPGTVAAFGHGGESAAVFSHLFNLPFPFTCGALGPDYTGITAVTWADTPGALISPRLDLLNDARHIRDLRTDNIFDR